MWTLRITLIALTMVWATHGFSEEAKTIHSNENIKVVLRSTKEAKQYPVYTGDGPAISQLSIPGMGMSMIIMIKEDDGKSYSYMARNITAAEGKKFLVARCAVTNKGQSVQSFRIGAVHVVDGEDRRSFSAVGEGEYAFAKEGDQLDKVKLRILKIEPGTTKTLVYLFTVSDASKDCQIIYSDEDEVESES